MSDQQLNGQCLCGAITYQICGYLGKIYHCHCSKCRRWGGDAFRTSTMVKASDFSWLSGEAHLAEYAYSDTVTKTFCSICGTNLISLYVDQPDILGISLGGLEQDPGARPQAHIFVDSKASWYDIDDKLPQYSERADNV